MHSWDLAGSNFSKLIEVNCVNICVYCSNKNPVIDFKLAWRVCSIDVGDPAGEIIMMGGFNPCTGRFTHHLK